MMLRHGLEAGVGVSVLGYDGLKFRCLFSRGNESPK